MPDVSHATTTDTPASPDPAAPAALQGGPSPVLRVAEAVVLGGLTIWLFVAAATFGVEYWDGWDSISSARGLIDASPYQITRGPLLPTLMVPAEMLRRAVGAGPLTLWPYHLVMAVVHAGYLLAVYVGLLRWLPRDWSTLVAFVAAVPCWMWFNQAPYLSHDILSGALLLWMAILSTELMRRPSRGAWIAIVAIGAAAACHKHMFASFWVIVLIAHLSLLVTRAARGKGRLARDLRRWGTLALASVASGVITWIAYAIAFETVWVPGYATEHPINEASQWLRPYYLLPFYSDYAAATWPSRNTWIYGRHALAYGPLAVALLVPALAMAWSQAHCRRLIAPALIWLLNVAFLVAVPYGEVRYMLILTPLTALLIVPPLRWLLVRRAGMAIAVVALVVTAAPGWGYGLAPQAARVASPFYSVNQARTFFEPVLRDFPPARTTIWNGRNLTFADATPSPLHGDRFNDLHHFAAAHLYLLLDYDADKITASEVGGLLDWPADSVLVTVEGGPLNNPMKGRLTASRRMKLRQTVATHQDLVLMPNEDGAGYRTHDGRPVEVSFVPGGIAIGTHPDEVAKATVWLSGEALAAEVRHMLHLRLRVAGLDGVRRAARGEDGRVAVPADDAFLAAIEARRPIKLYGFRIEHVHGFAEPGEPAVFATPTDTPELIDGIGRPGDGSRP